MTDAITDAIRRLEDPLIPAIVAELVRQGDANTYNAPYVLDDRGPDALLVDGEIDLPALARAIRAALEAPT